MVRYTRRARVDRPAAGSIWVVCGIILGVSWFISYSRISCVLAPEQHCLCPLSVLMRYHRAVTGFGKVTKTLCGKGSA